VTAHLSHLFHYLVFGFWFLDSYYLRQERLFRKLHNYIVKYRLNDDNNLFDMNIIKFSSDVQSTLRIMFSISTLPFYGSIFIKVLRYCLF